MPLTTDLATMRDAVYRTSDTLNFTEKHPSDRVDDLICQGLGALSRICRTTNPEFQPIASTLITMDGVSTMYSLPATFRSLLAVEYLDGNNRKHWLTPYNLSERAALTSPQTTAQSLRALGYRLMGTNLEFLPRPPVNHQATVWFATTVTQLATDAATFDTMDRLDTWVIWWAAREIAMEREAWERHDRLTAKMDAMADEIRILARSLDLSHPTRITDTALSATPRPWPRRRYRWP